MTIHQSDRPDQKEDDMGRYFIDHLNHLERVARRYRKEDHPLGLVHDVYLKMIQEEHHFKRSDDFKNYAQSRIKSEFLDQQKGDRSLKRGGSGRDGAREPIKIEVDDLDMDRAQGKSRIQLDMLAKAIDQCLNSDDVIFEKELLNRSQALEKTVELLMDAFREGDIPRARHLVGVVRETLDPVLDRDFADVAPAKRRVSEIFNDSLNTVLTKELSNISRNSSYEDIEDALARRANAYIAMRLGIRKAHRGEVGWMGLVFKRTESVILYLNKPEKGVNAKALLMKEYLGLSLIEIGEQLGVSERRVRYLIKCAKEEIQSLPSNTDKADSDHLS